MTKEALTLALEALEYSKDYDTSIILQKAAITAIKEALQEHALQALHDENERLGLYKGVYEEEPQHPVHIGVDVTKEGIAVTAFYRKPDSVMEMFYSQFHPLAQPEQEKERCVGCEACIDTACGRDECPKGWPKAAQPEQKPFAWYAIEHGEADIEWNSQRPIYEGNWKPLYRTPPQRTDQEQQIETLKRCLFQMQEAAKDLVEQAKSLPPTQRKPLTDEEIGAILEGVNAYGTRLYTFARAIEAAHGIKE